VFGLRSEGTLSDAKYVHVLQTQTVQCDLRAEIAWSGLDIEGMSIWCSDSSEFQGLSNGTRLIIWVRSYKRESGYPTNLA